MHTRLLLGLSAAAVVAAATPAHAQLPVHFGIGAGASVPQSDLADAVDMGYNAAATLTIAPPLLPLSVRGELSYNGFGMKPTSVAGVTASGNYRVLGAAASLVYSLPIPSPVKPYLLAGGGVYNVNASRKVTAFGVTATSDTSATHVGFGAGAGLRLGLVPMHPSVEVRYVHIGADKSKGEMPMTFVPVTFSLTF